MTDREHAAWQGFLTLHATLTEEIDRSLRESHGLTLQHFEVLLHLEEAPGNRMRMTDLATSVRLSQSGVTLNIFMLEDSDGLARFMERLAERTGGRVFLMDDRNVGEFVLRDYVRHRSR